MKRHVLKTWPSSWDATYEGRKPFEFRFDDRDYEVGDHLVLVRWDPSIEKYTGRALVLEVTYMLRGRFDVPSGYCVMGIPKVLAETTARAVGIPKREIQRETRQE